MSIYCHCSKPDCEADCFKGLESEPGTASFFPASDMIAALVKDKTESFISPGQYFPELIRAIEFEREKFGKEMVPQRVIAHATPAKTGVQKLLIMPD